MDKTVLVVHINNKKITSKDNNYILIGWKPISKFASTYEEIYELGQAFKHSAFK